MRKTYSKCFYPGKPRYSLRSRDDDDDADADGSWCCAVTQRGCRLIPGMWWSLIDPNEPWLTGAGGFRIDSDHHTAQQETRRDGALCAEPGSHIIQSSHDRRGAKQRGDTWSPSLRSYWGGTGRDLVPCVRRCANNSRGSQTKPRGIVGQTNTFLIPMRFSHSRLKSAYKRAPPWDGRGGEAVGTVRRLHLRASSRRWWWSLIRDQDWAVPNRTEPT